jgi:hypothetical protein
LTKSTAARLLWITVSCGVSAIPSHAATSRIKRQHRDSISAVVTGRNPVEDDAFLALRAAQDGASDRCIKPNKISGPNLRLRVDDDSGDPRALDEVFGELVVSLGHFAAIRLVPLSSCVDRACADGRLAGSTSSGGNQRRR